MSPTSVVGATYAFSRRSLSRASRPFVGPILKVGKGRLDQFAKSQRTTGMLRNPSVSRPRPMVPKEPTYATPGGAIPARMSDWVRATVTTRLANYVDAVNQQDPWF